MNTGLRRVADMKKLFMIGPLLIFFLMISSIVDGQQPAKIPRVGLL
jgi:hypothetical protein